MRRWRDWRVGAPPDETYDELWTLANDNLFKIDQHKLKIDAKNLAKKIKTVAEFMKEGGITDAEASLKHARSVCTNAFVTLIEGQLLQKLGEKADHTNASKAPVADINRIIRDPCTLR